MNLFHDMHRYIGILYKWDPPGPTCCTSIDKYEGIVGH